MRWSGCGGGQRGQAWSSAAVGPPTKGHLCLRCWCGERDGGTMMIFGGGAGDEDDNEGEKNN